MTVHAHDVRPEHYAVVNRGPAVPDVPAAEEARRFLLGHLRKGQAAHWPVIDEAPQPIHVVALVMASLGIIPRPAVGALAHHTIQQGWHQDRLAPPGHSLAILVFRERCNGGMLVDAGARTAWRLLDLETAHVDGMAWLGLTPIVSDQDGYRMSLTLYVPPPA